MIAKEPYICYGGSSSIKKGSVYWDYKEKKYCGKCRKHVLRKRLENGQKRCKI